MSQATAIEWTDVSWNPVHGCSIVSTECRNCYAMTLSLRYGQTKKPWTPANAAENVILKPHKLREPLGKGKLWTGLGTAAAAAGKTDGKLVFVNSTSDLFHEQVPEEFIAQVFAVMALAHWHTFQVLTKRPERMRDVLKSWRFCKLTTQAILDIAREREIPNAFIVAEQVEAGFEHLDNVWLGTSIGLRHFVGRADALRDTPAAVRFISAEPLLGSLINDCAVCHGGGVRCTYCDGRRGLELNGIDWLIAGGESGPKHRHCDPGWVADLCDACDREAVAFFFKQWGGPRPGGDARLDGREWREFPMAEEVHRAR